MTPAGKTADGHIRRGDANRIAPFLWLLSRQQYLYWEAVNV